MIENLLFQFSLPSSRIVSFIQDTARSKAKMAAFPVSIVWNAEASHEVCFFVSKQLGGISQNLEQVQRDWLLASKCLGRKNWLFATALCNLWGFYGVFYSCWSGYIGWFPVWSVIHCWGGTVLLVGGKNKMRRRVWWIVDSPSLWYLLYIYDEIFELLKTRSCLYRSLKYSFSNNLRS